MHLLAQTSSSGSPFSGTLWLIVLILATAYLLRRSYRYFGRRQDNAPIAHVARPGEKGYAKTIEAMSELTRKEVELHDTVRALSAQLDNKTRVLMQLVQQAEQRIAQLETLLEAADGKHAADPTAERALAPAEQNHSGVASTADSTVASAEDDFDDPAALEIIALAGQGFSAVTIAHKVHRSLIDVEAILAQHGVR